MRPSEVADLLSDPQFLLHGIDIDADRLIFVPTSHRLLEQASFLDGRNDIATGPTVACPISVALEVADQIAPLPDRFIFHVSFCGSTLLGRILDRPGRAEVLREPNVLVELADWKAELDRRSADDARFSPLVRLACASLRSRWQPGEPVIVKPSNWANNLLSDLCPVGGDARPLFIVSSRRSFLRAIFRGGRERLAFAARVAAHLASGSFAHQALLGAAARASRDPLGQVANFAVLAHWIQLQCFRRTMLAGGWGNAHVVSLDQIERAPLAAATAASAALDLDLSPADLAQGVAANVGLNAKQPGEPYSAEEHEQADRAIERLHGSLLDDALAWAADLLPEEVELAEPAEHGAGRRTG